MWNSEIYRIYPILHFFLKQVPQKYAYIAPNCEKTILFLNDVLFWKVL